MLFVSGLRGTISEVELHCIQARLQGALLSKVRRGELPLLLPVGFVRGQDGRVELDPDQEVQGAIRTVFNQFARLGTAKAVLRFFRDHALRVPRRPWGGPNHQQLLWVKPTYQTILLFLSNPTYAGAYAYGRRRRDEAGPAGLGPPGPRRRFDLDHLEVLLPDHHPGYLGWGQYLANRATLRDNTRQFAPSPGAPQHGPALLQGIVYCGRCGGRMRPRYSEPSPAYACTGRWEHYAEPICQSLTIAHVDRAVTEAFLAVVRPAELEATLALAEELERDRAQLDRQWRLRLERARYEAERARRQYDACEPENRLVARELETRWNDKLRELAALEEEYRRETSRGLSPLTDEEKELLRGLVGDLPGLWQRQETTVEDRKRLLRCLIREVILTRDEGARGAGGTTTIRIGWRSGTWTELRVHRPGRSDYGCTPPATLERIRRLAQQATDERIAALLNADGLTTYQGLPWTALRVQTVRQYNHIPTACPVTPRSRGPRGDGLVPAGAAAELLGVSRAALAHWHRWGFLQGEQSGPQAPWWMRLTPDDVARLDGTLAAQGYGRWRIREAKQALGLSEEQIWEKARRRELIGYRARVGDHWEWRVSPTESNHSGLTEPSAPIV